MKNLLPFGFIFLFFTIFFWQFLFKGLLPIPSDTIIGLYHPFRDLYSKDYPRGIPFKNFLVTDPVRQQYPWKNLSIVNLKNKDFPLWNQYNFAGTPLLANFQSGFFYPINFLFLILPFNLGWSIFVVLGVVLSSIFMFLFLRNLKITKAASLLGSLCFSMSGFSIAWLEWGNILHTALWLPLILLSIDKIFSEKKILFWMILLIFSLTSSFFAGHLQIFFYVFITSLSYLLVKFFQVRNKKGIFLGAVVCFLLFIFLSFPQWASTLQFILESARSTDQLNWQNEGWFIPWQNLIHFVAPDFFGNPATLNYWGVFNYGEFVGYIGIFPLIFALFALFQRRNKEVLFFGSLFFISLIFSLPTILAKIPYILNIPLLSTSQPTRLLFITDFSLAVLAGIGLDLFIKNRKQIIYPITFLAIIFLMLWGFTVTGTQFATKENLLIAQRNLIFPSILFAIAVFTILFSVLSKNKRIAVLFSYIVLIIVVFDLLRFGLKFTPFTKQEYLFPQTKATEFLQNQDGYFRIMSTDTRILPPNFSIMYKLETIDGYDPLYLRRYAELIAASERKEPNIQEPLGFNRIITPQNYNSKIIDLLGVKYILSLSDLNSPNHKKVFTEGETRVYENKNALERAFFVRNVITANNKSDAIEKVFNVSLTDTAVIESNENFDQDFSLGEIKGISYKGNSIIIDIENRGDGFLVLTDSFYPTWKVKIDGKESKIYRTNYNFRGVLVPEGNHKIEFINSII